MKILVTDGENRAALAITRSLGRKGHAIVVGEHSQPSLAERSRYCVESVIYPDPTRDSNGFVETLLERIRQSGVDVVLPVNEISTGLVVEHRSAFDALCHVPFPDAATFDRAADKVEIVRLAQRLGVPTPLGVVLEKPGDRPPFPKGLRFPLVIKPHRSRVKISGGWRATSVSYVESESELESVLAPKPAYEYPLLLQERIVGPGMGVFMCYAGGRLVALFSHRRLREKPPAGGVSVLRESIPIDPQARLSAQLLLDHLRWRGVAMVEFKVDQADGIPKLMEINGRFWGSLQLAIDAGVDFPAILIAASTGSAVEPIESYRVGVKSRWLLGDLDALLMRLMKRDGQLNLPPGHPGRIQALAQFLRMWEPHVCYEVWKWADVRPGMHELSRWLSRNG